MLIFKTENRKACFIFCKAVKSSRKKRQNVRLSRFSDKATKQWCARERSMSGTKIVLNEQKELKHT